MKHKRTVIVIRKSRLTGRAVWIYKGPTKAAARTAYCRACKMEMAHVSNWDKTTAHRRANVHRILDGILADMPADAVLTPEQQQAITELQRLAKENMAYPRDFYEYIVAERLRHEAGPDSVQCPGVI